MIWSDCIYEYDGSYYGLLCCVFDSYTRKETPVSIVAGELPQTTLYPLHTVETEAAHARRILKSLNERSKLAAELARRAYLTCLADREVSIYRMIRKLYEEGPAFLKNPADPAVYPLHVAIRQLFGELEKLRGFIRFSLFDGVYAAEIEPKNRVLPALRGHFCNRFADQAFLIYDRTHKEGLFYAHGNWRIIPLDSFEMARPDQAEAAYRRLWKTFYDTISIKERENPRCQRTHMPLRYRTVMTEFQDEGYFLPREDAPGTLCSVPSCPVLPENGRK